MYIGIFDAKIVKSGPFSSFLRIDFHNFNGKKRYCIPYLLKISGNRKSMKTVS